MRKLVVASLALLLSAATAFADDPIRPDPRLTPGEAMTTNLGVVCRPGYTRTVRHTSGTLKRKVYRKYGIDRRGGHYEIDHLVPLELGGADIERNLWPQSYDTQPWNAHVKDVLENYLQAKVCAGRMPIEEAQNKIAADWIAAYEQLLGEPGLKRRRFPPGRAQ